jgi:glycosyltransferase involved in cell wall biosynthesis
MKIGIVLCTYNGERYLREQLDSILAQERLPDEVLVQDDGSTDQTLSILDSYAAKAPFAFNVVRNPQNLGFVRNFELAIARCSADVIAMSDQDDSWRSDKLRKMEQIFRSDTRISVLFSEAQMVDERLASLGHGVLQALRVSNADLERVRRHDFLPVLLRRNIAPGATMALRAERTCQMLPIPEGAYHDEWLTLVAATFGELGFCTEPLIRYRQHATNQLGARPEKALSRIRKALRPISYKEDLRRLKVMENLHERAQALGCRPEVLAEVKGKLDHVRMRTSLSSSRLHRIGPIVRELVSGRYFKYSSWRGALRDVLISR